MPRVAAVRLRHEPPDPPPRAAERLPPAEERAAAADLRPDGRRTVSGAIRADRSSRVRSLCLAVPFVVLADPELRRLSLRRVGPGVLSSRRHSCSWIRALFPRDAPVHRRAGAADSWSTRSSRAIVRPPARPLPLSSVAALRRSRSCSLAVACWRIDAALSHNLDHGRAARGDDAAPRDRAVGHQHARGLLPSAPARLRPRRGRRRGVPARAVRVRRRRCCCLAAVAAPDDGTVVRASGSAWRLCSIASGGSVVAGRVACRCRRRRVWALTAGPLAGRLRVMDPEWLRDARHQGLPVSPRWPLYAWIINLGYLPVIALDFYRGAARAGLVDAANAPSCSARLPLACVFVCARSCCHACGDHLAFQLQPARVFWMFDFLATVYAVWALAEGTSPDRARAAGGAGVMALLSFDRTRSLYVLSRVPIVRSSRLDARRTTTGDG